jgi:hypothetical protein
LGRSHALVSSAQQLRAGDAGLRPAVYRRSDVRRAGRRALGAPAMPTRKTFHPNGTLRSEQLMVNGRSHGLGRSWHPNGQLQSETPFCDGIMHGVCKFWAADGQPLGSFEMVHGTGTFRTWYEDGRLRTEVSSVRGLPRYDDETTLTRT